ncbi:hypothetical protein GCM10017673_34700 [Streptosporangium violaceochromogenes]|nr:hypothetical protein GCM10017673_34700 [Streptosporangium violaceochromogenes]
MVVMEQVQPLERSPGRAVTVAAYVVLVMLGLVMGVLGAFQHSWYARPVPIPVAAPVCVPALFAVCRGAGWGMGTRSAALAPAAGWLAVTTIWLSDRPEGDVVIAGDLSGYIYLYGGLIAALVGVMLTPAAGGGSWLLTPRLPGSRPSGLR